MRRTILTAGTAAAALAAAGTAPAQTELVYGSHLTANNDAHEDVYQPYFDAVAEATNGEIQWELVPGAQLAEVSGTPEAVAAGLMDAGLVMAPYTPRMLPATNLIFSQSLLGTDYLASVGAMNETVMLDCPQCQEEYAENNAVGYAGYGVAPYLFMCNGDITGYEDLQNARIRASGGGVNITELIGGTPISMSPSEATSALERGTLDCVLGSVAWLRSYGYLDVVDNVIEAPMGMGGPPLLMYVNRDVWTGMTPEQRAAHLELAPQMVSDMTYEGQIAVNEAAIASAKERGITFHEGGEELAAVMEEHDAMQYDINAGNAGTAGVESPEAILDAYLANYEKWKGLIAEQGEDRETFQRLLGEEVYSQVDPEAL